MRMFASALWRNISDCAFEDLQQSLLHSLARNVARDRWVFVFAANLVDFVNIDNALLSAFYITVGGLQEFQNDVLDVFTDVPGFSKRGGIDDCERHAEHARQRLCEECLAGPGWADQQDVRLLNLNLGTSASQLDPFVVLVDGDGQTLLGFFLSDYILVKKAFDLSRLGQRRPRRNGFSLLIVGDDLIADVDALVADVDGGTGNEFLNFILRLTTK